MDETHSSNLYSHCCCCLSNSEETRLKIHVLQNKTLKTILQSKQLTLCAMCKRVARRVEKFIRNVELNQPYFEYKKNKPDWEISSNNENLTPVPTPQHDTNEDFNSSFNDPEFNLFLEKELNDIIGVAANQKMRLNREIGVQVNETSFNSITAPSKGKTTAIDIFDTTSLSENTDHEQTEQQESALNDTVILFDSININDVEKENKSAHDPIEFKGSKQGPKLTKTLTQNVATPFSSISSDFEVLANENSIDNIRTPIFNNIDSELDNTQDSASDICSIEITSEKVNKATFSSTEPENLMEQQSDTELNEISSYILDKGKAFITEKISNMSTQINLHVTAKAIYDPIIPNKIDMEVVPQGKEKSVCSAVTSFRNINMEQNLQGKRKALLEPVTYDLNPERSAQENEKSFYNTAISLKDIERNLKVNAEKIGHEPSTSHKETTSSVLEPQENNGSKTVSLKNINTEFGLQERKAITPEYLPKKITQKDLNISSKSYEDILKAKSLQEKDKCAYSFDKSLFLNNEHTELPNTDKIQEPKTPYDDIINLESEAQESEKNIGNNVTLLKYTDTEIEPVGENAIYEPISPYEDIVSETLLNKTAIYSSAAPLKSVLNNIDAHTRNEETKLNEKSIYNTPVKTVHEKTKNLADKAAEIDFVTNNTEETINMKKENSTDSQANEKPIPKSSVGIDIQGEENFIFKTPTAFTSNEIKLKAFEGTTRDKNTKSLLSKKKISTHVSERGHKHKYFNLNFNAEIKKKIDVMKRLLAEIPKHENIDSPIEQIIEEMSNVPDVPNNPETSQLDDIKNTSEIPLSKRIHILEDIRIFPTEIKLENLSKICDIKEEPKIEKTHGIEEIENSTETLESVNVLRIIEEMKKAPDAKSDSPMTYFRNKVIEFNRKKADLKHQFNFNRKEEVPIEIVYLTEEQCMEERRKKSEDKIYKASKFKCENCIRGFSTKTTLENHVATHSMVGQHECLFCKQLFISQQTLKEHYKLHFRRYKCSKCDFMKSSRCPVKDHYNQLHSDGVPAYECPRCGVKYKVKHSLFKHIKSKHVNVTYPCPHCDKIYTLKQSLTVHLIGRHPKLMGLEQGKQFVCETCDQGFSTSSSLSCHRHNHNTDKEFNCVQCNKFFKTESALRKHFNSSVKHASVRFTCDYCGEKFSLKSKLLRHIYEHLGKKPYPCRICSKGYYILSKLKEHMRTAHRSLPSSRDISCHVCQKIFLSKKILNVHLRIHTGETPYECDKCPAKFASTGSLSNHKKLVHLGWKRKQNKIVNVDMIT